MDNSHGGEREGAGRPKKEELLELGGESRSEIINTFTRIAEENGTTFGEELAKLVFGKRKEKRLKMQAMQLYVRDVLPKTSERDVTGTEITKPQVFVPEKYPDSDEAPDYKTAPPPDFKTH